MHCNLCTFKTDKEAFIAAYGHMYTMNDVDEYLTQRAERNSTGVCLPYEELVHWLRPAVLSVTGKVPFNGHPIILCCFSGYSWVKPSALAEVLGLRCIVHPNTTPVSFGRAWLHDTNIDTCILQGTMETACNWLASFAPVIPLETQGRVIQNQKQELSRIHSVAARMQVLQITLDEMSQLHQTQSQYMLTELESLSSRNAAENWQKTATPLKRFENDLDWQHVHQMRCSKTNTLLCGSDCCPVCFVVLTTCQNNLPWKT